MTFGKHCFCIFISYLLLNFAIPTVGLEAASPPVNNQLMHTIQVGSYKKHSDAQKELERLRSFVQQAFVRHETVKDKGMWYRVCIGVFATKAQAMAFADDLIDKKIIASIWVKTLPPPFPDFDKVPMTEEKQVKAEEKEAADTGVKPSPPPPEIEKSKLAPPPEAKSVKPIGKKPVKPIEITPSEAEQGNLPPKKIESPKKTEIKEKGRLLKFSIGLKAGGFWANSRQEVEVIDTGKGTTWSYLFSQRYLQGGLVVSCLFNDRFFLSGSIEKSFITAMDISQFELDTGINFNRIGPITPFANIGIIYGNIQWDEFPMEFDSALGWKIGGGGFYNINKIQIGFEVAYQAIEYTFDIPFDISITGGAESVDLSGFSVAGLIRYQF